MLRNAQLVVREVESDQDLAREGDRPTHCPLLVDGFACRYKMMSGGQRQILAFHVPTDLCDLISLTSARLHHSILTLTPAQVIFIPYSLILDWAMQSPRLQWLLWRGVLIDTAIANEWIVNVGRRTAQRRTAHLFCEMIERLRRVRRTTSTSCALPFTQVVLADALGLTPVHVNRTLRWLRSERLVELSGGVLNWKNWNELKQMADFDLDYLG